MSQPSFLKEFFTSYLSFFARQNPVPVAGKGAIVIMESSEDNPLYHVVREDSMSTKLTPQQLAVVENCGGDLLVSAAADSGKTKVLVEKLMREICVNKRNIIDFIIITYTQKAASELRMKIRPEIAARLAENPGDKQREAKELRCAWMI